METQISKTAQLAQDCLRDILSHLGMTATFSVVEKDGVTAIDITTNHDDLLIGRSSEPLLALQHLLRIMLRAKDPESESTISLNVGDYHEQQQARLTTIAKNAAEQARATKLAVYLPTMSSYERRIVHMVVGEETGVVSESEGVGASRRLVIKPQN